MGPYLARRTLNPSFILMIKFHTKNALIFVALWASVIAQKSVCSKTALNMKRFNDRSMIYKIIKKQTPFELKEYFT